ncbi:hypothetical protein HK414_22910 [Ramlibacter terrae]|uniref:Uncharacterized protein n=1 Tax=Ramlibacter terrae TaxID=2732511 RepID=A0ABX6P8D2_9BURK|nr:hypothetical protein HK414_22910 [Ramlibacter terrae]
MKYSLRKTPSHLHLTYKYGEASGGLLGRNLVLEADGNVLTLEVDLSANLLARNKSSPWYPDAVALSTDYHKLKSLVCPDNPVRTRLIRAGKASNSRACACGWCLRRVAATSTKWRRIRCSWAESSSTSGLPRGRVRNHIAGGRLRHAGRRFDRNPHHDAN